MRILLIKFHQIYFYNSSTSILLWFKSVKNFFSFQKSKVVISRVVILDQYLEDCNRSSESNFSVSAVTKGNNTSVREASQKIYFRRRWYKFFIKGNFFDYFLNILVSFVCLLLNNNISTFYTYRKIISLEDILIFIIFWKTYYNNTPVHILILYIFWDNDFDTNDVKQLDIHKKQQPSSIKNYTIVFKKINIHKIYLSFEIILLKTTYKQTYNLKINCIQKLKRDTLYKHMYSLSLSQKRRKKKRRFFLFTVIIFSVYTQYIYIYLRCM